MISQNGVRFDNIIINDPTKKMDKPGIIRVGKRKFIRIVLR